MHEVRTALAPVGLFLALILVVPSAGAVPFASDLSFADLATARSLPVLSGALAVDAQAGGAPAVLVNVTAFQVDGVAVACWQYPCVRSAGALSVAVASGSTVALRFPTAGSIHLGAAHAVASPISLDAAKAGFGELAAGMAFAPSLAAATRDGVLTFEPKTLAPLPNGPVPTSPPPGVPLPPAVAAQFLAPDPDDSNSALLAGLTPTSIIEVREGGRVLQTLRGYSGLLLQGTIRATPIQAESFIVPCAERCDLVVTANGPGAGVLGAVQSLLGLSASLQGIPVPAIALGPLESLVDPLADGALVQMPLLASPADFRVANLTFMRFDRLEAVLYPGAAPIGGSGDLVVQSGNVQGAPSFVGSRYFGMPVWSYILWAAAVVALVLRLAIRRGEEPAGGKAVPRIVGVLGLLALVVVWHLAFARIVGVGATSPGLDAATRGIVAGVELATLLLMAAMVVLPARLLLRNGLRLVGLPRVARFGGTAALAFGAVVGPLILLGIIDLVLGMFP